MRTTKRCLPLALLLFLACAFIWPAYAAFDPKSPLRPHRHTHDASPPPPAHRAAVMAAWPAASPTRSTRPRPSRTIVRNMITRLSVGAKCSRRPPRSITAYRRIQCTLLRTRTRKRPHVVRR